MQEFLLTVVRPKTMEHLCINVSLETLHIGAIVDDAAPSENEQTVDVYFPLIGQNGSWPDPDETQTYPRELDIPYDVQDGWVVDRYKGNTGRGYDEVVEQAGPETVFTVDVTDTSVTMHGRVVERHIDGGLTGRDDRVSGFLKAKITLYLRRAKPGAPKTKQFAVLADTSVCTCPAELPEFPKLMDRPSMVREISLAGVDSRLGRPMEQSEAAEWAKALSRVVRSSISSPDRYPRGEVDFWDLDVMREPLAASSERRGRGVTTVREQLQSGHLAGDEMTAAIREYLRDPDVAERSVAELLRPQLTELVAGSGLTYREAVSLRRALWDATASTTRSAKGQ